MTWRAISARPYSVRVIRKGEGKNEYIYEGEYKVEGYEMLQSEDGPWIFQFRLTAIPGRSKAPAPPVVGPDTALPLQFTLSACP